MLSQNKGCLYLSCRTTLNLELASFFSRKEEYDALYKQLSELRDRQTKDEKKELLKQIRKLRKSIDALVEIDYYPMKLKHSFK
jgi:hypothetical protein